jgi:hypothetical protein
MWCRVAITAVLAFLLLATSLKAEELPLDGITGLQRLPTTVKGELFGACFDEMLRSYGTSEQILYDIRVNRTGQPIEISLAGQFSEQVRSLALPGWRVMLQQACKCSSIPVDDCSQQDAANAILYFCRRL